MQNAVPALGAVELEVADRALSGRREQYAAEVRRLIDAAFTVMRRTGQVDPPVRDVVAEAGLSNQAFYRHFPSKDALMLAVLADGRRQLVEYLAHVVHDAEEPVAQLRRWVGGVMEQVRNPYAAAATRPFVVNAARLNAAFPDAVAASRDALIETVLPTVVALGGDRRAAELVHDLVMRRMEDALVAGRQPDDDEVDHLVSFLVAGVTHGT